MEEYYCDANNNLEQKTYFCPEGCYDGVCINQTIPNIYSKTETIRIYNSTVAFIFGYYNGSFSIANCTVIVNSTLNLTRSSYVNPGYIESNPFVFDNLANGNYYWGVNCIDSYNKKHESLTYLITIAVFGNAGPSPPVAISTSGGGGSGGGGGGGARARIAPTLEEKLPGPTTAEIEQAVKRIVNSLEDSNVKSAVAEVVGGSGGSSVFNEMIKNSEIIVKSVIVSREIESKTPTSTLLYTNIKYTGKDLVKDFMVYDIIPKTFASDISEVIVSIPTKAKYNVIEKDPKILIIFDNITEGETNTITYSVNKQLNKAILNEFGGPTLFAKETISKEGIKKPLRIRYLWYFIGGAIVLIVILYLIVKSKTVK